MTNILANTFGYPALIWELFNQAPNSGFFEEDTPGLAHAQVGTPANESVLELSVIWREHRVVEARFRAYGCPATIAVGAWLTDWCKGRGAADLLEISAADISCTLEITEDRAHCALMGEDVVRAVLAHLKK